MALGKFSAHCLHILPQFDDVWPSTEHPAENLELIAHQQHKLVTLPLQTTWIYVAAERKMQTGQEKEKAVRVGSE